MSRLARRASMIALVLVAACTAGSHNALQLTLGCSRPATVSLAPDPSSPKRLLSFDGCGCLRSLGDDGTVGPCRHVADGPGQISVDGSREVWVAEPLQQKVVVLHAVGSSTTVRGSGNSRPIAIATTSQLRGAWLIESESKYIRYISPAARVDVRFDLGAQPTSLAAQGQSALVVLPGGQVKRIDLNGKITPLLSEPHEEFRAVAPSSNGAWVLASSSTYFVAANGKTKRILCGDCSLKAGAAAADGSLWASDPLHATVFNIQPDGSVSKIVVGDRLHVPGSVAAAADGSVWVEVEFNAVKIVYRPAN